MPQFILLNGPPGCGKDTAVSHLVPYIDFTHLKFSAPLKRMVAALLNEDTRWIEENKDKIHKSLIRNLNTSLPVYDTTRELLIATSEDFLKVRYGENYLGYLMLNEVKKTAKKLIIISDSGFRDEAIPLIRQYGLPNFRLVRIKREGCTFDGDSRSYWSLKDLTTHTVHNDGTIHDLTMRVLRVIMKSYKTELLREPDWIK